MTDTLIVGFDRRGVSYGFPWSSDSSWSKRHRGAWDSLSILSTDSTVWPTVFNVESVHAPSMTNFGLWSNLNSLKWHLNRTPLDRPELSCTVAIVLEDKYDRWKHACLEDSIEVRTIVPDVIQDGWVFLGYDVSDLWLLSSLKNIDVPELKAINLESAMNKYQLFSKVEDANNYVQLSDTYCQSHSPFFAYGIWLVPDY